MADGPRTSRVREAIDKVIELLERGDLSKVALAVFRGQGKPSDRWSFNNRLIMLAHGTTDARGFRQWQEVGRYVKRGAKAFYIIAPVIKKVPMEVGEDEELEKKVIMVERLVGFRAVPVFRKEDTYGDPLPEDKLNPRIPARFEPLLRELGIKVRGMFFDGRTYGYYSPMGREIVLASDDTTVFLHELAHAVIHKLGLKMGRSEEEVVAEFSAAVIGWLMGYRVPYGNVKEYIERYGGSVKAVYGLLSHVGAVVEYVVGRTTDRRDWFLTRQSASDTSPELAVVRAQELVE